MNKKNKIETIILIAIIILVSAVFYLRKYQVYYGAQSDISITDNKVIQSAQTKNSQYQSCIQPGDKNVLSALYSSKVNFVYRVESSDTLWSLVERAVKEQFWFQSANQNKKNVLLDSMNDRFADMTSDQLKRIGVKSGDVNLLTQNDLIDLTLVLSDTYYLEKIIGDKNIDFTTMGFTRTNYSRDDSSVYFSSCKMEGVDINTFVPVSDRGARDANTFYINGVAVDEIADPASFVMLSDNVRGFSKDNQNVYFIDDVFHLSKINGLDPATFSIIYYSPKSEMYYLKDKNNIYYQDHGNYKLNGKIEGANVKSFKVIPNPGSQSGIDYLTDGYNVFCNGSRNPNYQKQNRIGVSILNGADADSFRILKNSQFSKDGVCVPIGDAYSIDKNQAYYACDIIKDTNPPSFELLPGGYSHDKNGFYFRNERFNSLDISSYQILGSGYIMDKNNVYFGTTVVEDVDRKTFEVLSGCGDAKDKNHKYINGKF